jgi:hypothetical protein
MPVSLSVRPFFCLSLCLYSVCPSLCPYVHPSVSPSVRLSVCPCVCPSVRLSVCPCVCLSIHPNASSSFPSVLCLSIDQKQKRPKLCTSTRLTGLASVRRAHASSCSIHSRFTKTRQTSP